MKFLELENVLEIQERLVADFGGATGARDLGSLQSAIGTPQLTFGGQFLNETIHEMAAAYLVQIVNNHPFIDGNKRCGATVASVFLIINGYELNPPEDLYTKLVLDVAQSKADKTDVTLFFREWATKAKA